MKRMMLIVPLLACLVVAACDFPADPPLKIAPPPKDTTAYNIDSAKVLLPLTPGNMWSYIAVTPGYFQLPMMSIALQAVYAPDTFTFVRYIFLTGGGPGQYVFGFPPILRNTPEGLMLYDRGAMSDTAVITKAPRLAFLLPYPSTAGAHWQSAGSEYEVDVASRDTLVTAYNNIDQYRCYVYTVQFRNRPKYRFYAIPGRMFLRVWTDNSGYVDFHTTGLKLK